MAAAAAGAALPLLRAMATLPLDAAALPRFSKDPRSILNKIVLHQGDITELKIDVIANAANSSLLGGGGVDGAIHRRAGPQMRSFNQTLGGCATGDVKASPGFKLPCQKVFHTVGPRREQPHLLKSCYIKSLDLLKDSGLRSIAFPCISTGVYGYPQLNAAKVVTECVVDWLKNRANYEAVDFVCFCVFSKEDYQYYQRFLNDVKATAPVSLPETSSPESSSRAAGEHAAAGGAPP